MYLRKIKLLCHKLDDSPDILINKGLPPIFHHKYNNISIMYKLKFQHT